MSAIRSRATRAFAPLALAAGLGLFAIQPALAAPETYKVDPAHTHVLFKVSHFGFSTFVGKFKTFEGSVVLDEAKPADSKVAFTIDLAGVSTDVAKLDEHLKSADFFDVAKFPTATFTSTAVTLTGDKTAKVVGDLTLHGVTKPVTLDVVLNKIGANPVSNAQSAGFGATTTLKRSDFGITTFSPNIGEDVVIEIQLEGQRS
ncbi:polyisoprenoid-binding protein [Rhodospirillum rubrum]|uniref:YceI family protein n=1 Tax=Rhodospirillum rubrum TaxID=1085 RepID=UPI001908E4B0|nr:YceI family protein [Rhodospirillum rubrum]MBK1663523.1 polyisoprenoid-binding protein [Rhodospirillum rubrum]MBK1677303.1 polyisoprenoid-binding protein [Rhodospirillum rubrum]